MSRDPVQRAWSERALAYFRTHAIAPEAAAACGVVEHGGRLSYPNVRDDGTIFYRVRDLELGRTLQPRGEPLTVWCPSGVSRRSLAALVTEGESDALAALTAIRGSRSRTLQGVAVVSVPGASFPVARLADHLAAAGVSSVWLAYDADTAGERATETAKAKLAEAGIAARELRFPAGMDLADCLVAADQPSQRIEQVLFNADPSADDVQHDREAELLRKAGVPQKRSTRNPEIARKHWGWRTLCACAACVYGP